MRFRVFPARPFISAFFVSLVSQRKSMLSHFRSQLTLLGVFSVSFASQGSRVPLLISDSSISSSRRRQCWGSRRCTILRPIDCNHFRCLKSVSLEDIVLSNPRNLGETPNSAFSVSSVCPLSVQRFTLTF